MTSSYNLLLSALESALNPTSDPTMTSKNQDLATAIDGYIIDVVTKVTGTSTVAPGIPVQTVPLVGTGSTVGPGTGTISAGNLTPG